MAKRWLLHAACTFNMFALAVAISTGLPVVRAVMALNENVTRNEQGVLSVNAGKDHRLLLLGDNIDKETKISFTPRLMPTNSTNCNDVKRSGVFTPTKIVKRGAYYNIHVDALQFGEKFYFLCVKAQSKWVYQGTESWLVLSIKEQSAEKEAFASVEVQICIIVLLLCFSGLFSGLNLGLMALDKTELEIIGKCGSPNEKQYAHTIAPLRKTGNFLLCTLLIGNVLVNSSATILLDALSSGTIALVVSTTSIVVFGEIIPQAICSRHGLAIGAKTSWITKLCMVLTFPVSYPLSLILDKVLGEDMGQVYDKEKLQELIRMTADQKVLENEEVKIIAGALQLANKTVEDVMTKIEDVYMLDIHTVLDFDTLAEILKHGYTRVPVYDGDKTKIVNLLNTKDLALIDPDDNTPLKTVCRFYDYQPLYVEHDMKLDAMLKEFLKGNSHMAIVQRLQNNGETDPFFENLGLVTLEDVIEEILQSEIIDETDMLTDNRRKFLRHRENNDYSVFEQEQGHKGRISQQLAYVAFQYLSTAVEPFKEQYISRNVLKQLLRQNLVVTLNPSTDNSDRNYIYRKGVECDYFVLILEGHLEVDIGKESMVFETGPFSCFGTACLDVLKDLNAVSVRDHKDLKFLPAYTPDFSLRACTNVQFLRIKRSHYLAARRATQMMTPSAADADQQEAFKREWRRATGGRDLHWAMSGVDPVPPVCKSKLDKIRESMSRRSVSKMDNALDRFESRESADVDTIKRKVSRMGNSVAFTDVNTNFESDSRSVCSSISGSTTSSRLEDAVINGSLPGNPDDAAHAQHDLDVDVAEVEICGDRTPVHCVIDAEELQAVKQVEGNTCRIDELGCAPYEELQKILVMDKVLLMEVGDSTTT